MGVTDSGECPNKQENKPPEEEKTPNPSPQDPPPRPPEEELPSVRELITRTEELLGIWRKLGEKSASFT